MFKTSTLLKYILFQIPGIIIVCLIMFLLNMYLSVPFYVFIVILTLWVLKELVLYPFTWKSYCTDYKSAANSMIGKYGYVIENFTPRGKVKIGAEIWNAVLEDGTVSAEIHSRICVVEIRGLTLIVVPVI